MSRLVLVVDDDELIRQSLGQFLQHRGFQVLTAKNGEEGFDVYQRERPEITFTDLKMPRMGGLELMKEILSLDTEAHIVVMTAYGNDEAILEALRGGAEDFFKKPLDYTEVNEALTNIEIRILEAEGQGVDQGFVLEEQIRLEIPNDLNIVSSVVNKITGSLRYFFESAVVHGIQGALIEMVVNAIEHGSLGISYEEKTQALEADRLNALILEKSQQPELACRRVRIDYHLTTTAVTYIIEDEGNGFKIDELPDPGDPENLWLGHGRGILMTQALMDEVKYNEKGNQVTLVKNLPTIDVLEMEEFEEVEEVEQLEDLAM
ncbi:MAG: response regulator [Planctomycetota bacterium]|nr:response regulator [Planctomycetota bacterium]MDA1142810.1 response regulator [Planctomycetota bacterium]